MKKLTLVMIIMTSIMICMLPVSASSMWTYPQSFDNYVTYGEMTNDIVIGQLPSGGSNAMGYSYYVSSIVYRSFYSNKIDKGWYLQIQYFESNPTPSGANNTINGPFPNNLESNIPTYTHFAWPLNVSGIKWSCEYYKLNKTTGKYDFFRYGNDVNTMIPGAPVKAHFLITNWSNIAPSLPVRTGITDNWNPLVQSTTPFMNSDVPPDPTITATAGAGGSISPSGTMTITRGGSQKFTFTPDAGYLVDSIKVNGVPVLTAGSYTMTNVKSNSTIEVTFRENGVVPTFTITSTFTEGGRIDPAGVITLNRGADQVFNIIPDSGYKIVNVTVDGIYSQGIKNQHTFSNISKNHTIHAVFEKKTTKPRMRQQEMERYLQDPMMSMSDTNSLFDLPQEKVMN